MAKLIPISACQVLMGMFACILADTLLASYSTTYAYAILACTQILHTIHVYAYTGIYTVFFTFLKDEQFGLFLSMYNNASTCKSDLILILLRHYYCLAYSST